MAGKEKKKQEREVSFEEAMKRLELVVGQLENGDLPLEEAIGLAEEGLKLSQYCERQLTEAEGKIVQLVERMGVVKEEPLNTTNETEEDDD